MAEIDLPLIERIAAQRRFSPTTVQIAKGLFVEGFDARRLALEHGLHVKRVYAIRKEFLDAAQAMALPRGWEEVTFAAPRDVIEELRRLYAQRMKEVRRGSAR